MHNTRQMPLRLVSGTERSVFAAPEQYTGEPLDCRTDVYAIGALLYFMSRGDAPGSVPEYRNEPEYRIFDRIIRGCMEKEKEARYQSADELQETLQELQNQLKEQAAESRIVVLPGRQRGSEQPMRLSECLISDPEWVSGFISGSL